MVISDDKSKIYLNTILLFAAKYVIKKIYLKASSWKGNKEKSIPIQAWLIYAEEEVVD